MQWAGSGRYSNVLQVLIAGVGNEFRFGRGVEICLILRVTHGAAKQ
jgi:hypothetical protein